MRFGAHFADERELHGHLELEVGNGRGMQRHLRLPFLQAAVRKVSRTRYVEGVERLYKTSNVRASSQDTDRTLSQRCANKDFLHSVGRVSGSSQNDIRYWCKATTASLLEKKDPTTIVALLHYSPGSMLTRLPGLTEPFCCSHQDWVHIFPDNAVHVPRHLGNHVAKKSLCLGPIGELLLRLFQ